MHGGTQAFQQPFTTYVDIIQGLVIDSDQVKGDKDTGKEVGVPETVQQKTERPKARHPEPSKASATHASPLTKRLKCKTISKPQGPWPKPRQNVY